MGYLAIWRRRGASLRSVRQGWHSSSTSFAGPLTIQHWLPTRLDKESMATGIELTEWFKAETKRVYASLGESEKDRSRRQLFEWIDEKGGSVTVREVQRGLRAYGSSIESEAALADLSRAGYGHWRVRPPGPYRGPADSRFSTGEAVDCRHNPNESRRKKE